MASCFQSPLKSLVWLPTRPPSSPDSPQGSTPTLTLRQSYPEQEAIRAGELVIPDGLVHDEHAAQQGHGESDHARRGQL